MEYAGSSVITRQGQVTVPKKIRKANGMEIGTILDFYFNDEIIIVKPKSSPDVVFERLSKKTSERFKNKGMTRKDLEDEIDKARKEV